MLYEVELLSYIDHKAAEDYDTFTEVSKRGKVNAITRHAYVTGQNYFQVKIF